jgi:hypothetical protein
MQRHALQLNRRSVRYTRDFNDAGVGRKRFYTTEQLSAKRSLTPEGFLLCEHVPLARIGSQLYSENELPGLKGKDGLLNIIRDEEEVFKPAAILSFHGKPITNDHPPEKVTPENWKLYSVGTVLDPRRGDGIQYDNSFLYGDLLITDKQAIKDIEDGKLEVSAGYDAEYEQTQDGEGRQYNIIGNHVALVKKGRCGPLCMIGDQAMAVVRRQLRRSTFRDRILDAIQTGNDEALVEELDKVEDMIGEQVSGERSTRRGNTDEERVVINLNGSAGGGGGGSLSVGGGATSDQPDPNGGADPAAGNGDIAAQIAEMNQRMERIEQAIVLLAQGDDGGDGNGFDDPDDDGSMIGDEEADAPPSEDPELRPGNNMPYGEGTGSTSYRPSTAGGTNDRGRRRTRDRAVLRDHATQDDTSRRHFVGDSTSMRQEFQETLARAELLASGITMPTFDAKTPAKTTFDALCGLRRTALTRAMSDADKAAHIKLMAGDTPDFSKMTCDAVGTVFLAASELVRLQTNKTIGRPNGAAATFGTAVSPADINKANKAKYGIPN